MGRIGRSTVVAGLASYLDAGALVTSGLAIGGIYAESLDLDGDTIGLLLGLQTLSFAVGAVAGGRLADLVGRRRVLVTSLALYAVGVAFLAAAGDPYLLGVGVVLSGLGIGGDLPTSLTFVSEEAPEGAKGRNVALTQVFWGAGIGVTAFFAFLLADLGELAARLLYLHLLAVAIVVLLLRVNLVETAEWTAARATLRTRGPAVDRAHATVRPASRLRGPVAAAATATGAYYVLWTLGANTLGQFKPHLWIDVLGGSTRGASALVLVTVPLGLVGSLVFANLVDTRFRFHAVAVGALSMVGGWALVLASPTREAFVVLVVLSMLGATLGGEALYKVTTQELVPTLYRATVQGSTIAVARVVAAAFAVVTPSIASASLSRLAGGILLAQLLATAIALVWLPRVLRRDHDLEHR